MPNIGEYDNEKDWMGACVPVRIDEGDEQPQAVAVCMQMWRDKDKTKASNALKAISKTEDTLRVGNYIVLFGGRDMEGTLSNRKNPDGSAGEYFTPETALDSAYTKAGVLYVDWEHGQDGTKGAPGTDDILGIVDWSTAKTDERGVWVERALSRRNQYMQYLETLIEAGQVGNSSEAIGEQVQKAADGKITRWPLKRDTLTVTPMEPRMLTENVLQAYKALHLATPEPEAAPEAGQPAVTAAKEPVGMTITLDKATGNITIEGEPVIRVMEVKMSEKETPIVDVAAIVKEAADKAAADAVKAYRLELAKEPAINSGLVVMGDEADRALKGNRFKSFGELLMAAKDAAINPSQVDKRLLPVRSEDGFDVGAAMGDGFVGSLYGAARKGWATKQTDLSEGLGSHGGFLVGTDQNLGILARVYNVGQLLQRVDMMQISAGSNGTTLNFENEVSRATGARRGGIRAYWVAEGGGKTHSHPEFRQVAMRLIKCVALIYSTDELLQDATALESWIMANLPEEIRFTVEDAIINGTGAGQPLGILGGPGLVTQAIEVGQLNTTFVSQNAINMWSRRWLGARDYVWLVHQTVVPQLMQMGLAVGVGGMLTYMPPGGLSGVPYGTLFGAPVIESEYCQTLGTVGDVILVSLREYQMIEKGGMQSASSIHLAFLTDETIFRFVYRVQGMPKWNSALTPAHGGITTSPYVVLAGRP
jgi:HK97 family phage major capsid protein